MRLSPRFVSRCNVCISPFRQRILPPVTILLLAAFSFGLGGGEPRASNLASSPPTDPVSDAYPSAGTDDGRANEGAIADLEQMISKPDVPPSVRGFLRCRLLGLLLESQDSKWNAIQPLFEQIAAEYARGDIVVSDYELQILCRRVREAAASNRTELWDKGLSHLTTAKTLRFSKASFRQLERLVAQLRSSGGMDVQQTLVSLIVLVPDGDTLCALQELRIKEYLLQHDALSAQQAIALAVTMATGNESGPLQELNRCRALLAEAGAESAGDLIDFSGLEKPSLDRDIPLKNLAIDALRNQPPVAGGRRVMWLEAFAGRLEPCAKALAETMAHGSAIGMASDEGSAVWAMLSGGWQGNVLSTMVLRGELKQTNPASAAFVQALVKQYDLLCLASAINGNTDLPLFSKLRTFWLEAAAKAAAQRSALWARQAWDSNERTLAVSLLGASLNELRGPDVGSCFQLFAAGLPGQEVGVAVAMAKTRVLGIEQKDELLLSFAEQQMHAAQYKEALKALDEVHDAAIKEKQNATVCRIRAYCLIHVGEYEKAAAVLAGASKADGRDEDRAWLEFLQGWLYLHFNDRPRALIRLAGVVDHYPQTVIRRRAESILRELEIE